MAVVRSLSPSKRAEERPLTKSDTPYVIGMIVLDIAAPILLMYGLLNSPASSVSLLNNFEIVATTLIALLVFGERVTPTTWAAIVLITISAIILSTAGTGELSFSHGSLAVILACVCWGLENNCTRRLSDSGALRIVVIKGIFSGLGALAIAAFMGMGAPSAMEILGALLLGFVSYGMSLFFYITAQASLGAAKVSAYYAMAPFIGAFLSLAILGESLTEMFAHRCVPLPRHPGREPHRDVRRGADCDGRRGRHPDEGDAEVGAGPVAVGRRMRRQPCIQLNPHKPRRVR